MPRPKPFSRNSVSLSSTEKREWKNVPAGQIEPDDVVRDVGKIQHVSKDAYHGKVELISNDVFYFNMDETLFAFVKSSV
jgi:hypothetical protein